MPPRLIALYSPMPRCGKTTIAQHLEIHHGYISTSFATPMRRMIHALLRYADADGLLHLQGKEEPIESLPYRPSMRHLMRTIGTEWGRQCIGPSFWTQLWERHVHNLLDNGETVVVDDLRFPEEYDAVREMGGEIWRISRPGFDDVPAERHQSDGRLQGAHYRWDRIIHNDQSQVALLEYVDQQLA
ncbi:MAG: hypothetical protein WBM08_12590 [Prochlorococcaceae cyanobacterium]